MTLGRLLACFLVLLAFPVAAEAHTTILEPPESKFPYQRWVDEAKVPTPPWTVTVAETLLPCGYAHAAGCVDDGQIEVAPPGPGEHEREVFDHELGHVEDQAVLTPRWRARFTKVLGRAGDPWAPYVQEAFADAYSLCARRPSVPPSGKYRLLQARALTPATLSEVCRMVRAAQLG